jgi:hypothetical protein
MNLLSREIAMPNEPSLALDLFTRLRMHAGFPDQVSAVRVGESCIVLGTHPCDWRPNSDPETITSGPISWTLGEP